MNGRFWNLVNDIPLTPALSPEERETVMQRSTNRTLSVSVRLVAILPLLRGEGRGEGKRRAMLSHPLLRNPDHLASL